MISDLNLDHINLLKTSEFSREKLFDFQSGGTVKCNFCNEAFHGAGRAHKHLTYNCSVAGLRKMGGSRLIYSNQTAMSFLEESPLENLERKVFEITGIVCPPDSSRELMITLLREYAKYYKQNIRHHEIRLYLQNALADIAKQENELKYSNGVQINNYNIQIGDYNRKLKEYQSNYDFYTARQNQFQSLQYGEEAMENILRRELEEKKKIIDYLTSQLSQCNSSVRLEMATIDQLKKQIAAIGGDPQLKQAVGSYANTVQASTANSTELEEVRRQLAECKSKLTAASTGAASTGAAPSNKNQLEGTIKDKQDKINKLNNEVIPALKARIKELEAKAAELNDIKLDKKKYCQDLVDEAKRTSSGQCSTTISTGFISNEKHEELIKAKEEEINEKQREIDKTLQPKIDNLTASLTACRTSEGELRTELGTLKTKKDQIAAACKKFEEEAQKARAALIDAISKISGITLSETQTGSGDDKQTVKSIEDLIKELSNEVAQKQGDISSYVKSTGKTLSKLTAEKQKVEAELEALKEAKDTNGALTAQKEALHEKLKAQVPELTAKITELKGKVSNVEALETKVETLEEYKDKINNKIQNIIDTYEVIKKAIETKNLEGYKRDIEVIELLLSKYNELSNAVEVETIIKYITDPNNSDLPDDQKKKLKTAIEKNKGEDNSSLIQEIKNTIGVNENTKIKDKIDQLKDERDHLYQRIQHYDKTVLPKIKSQISSMTENLPTQGLLDEKNNEIKRLEKEIERLKASQTANSTTNAIQNTSELENLNSRIKQLNSEIQTEKDNNASNVLNARFEILKSIAKLFLEETQTVDDVLSEEIYKNNSGIKDRINHYTDKIKGLIERNKAIKKTIEELNKDEYNTNNLILFIKDLIQNEDEEKIEELINNIISRIKKLKEIKNREEKKISADQEDLTKYRIFYDKFKQQYMSFKQKFKKINKDSTELEKNIYNSRDDNNNNLILIFNYISSLEQQIKDQQETIKKANEDKKKIQQDIKDDIIPKLHSCKNIKEAFREAKSRTKTKLEKAEQDLIEERSKTDKFERDNKELKKNIDKAEANAKTALEAKRKALEAKEKAEKEVKKEKAQAKQAKADAETEVRKAKTDAEAEVKDAHNNAKITIETAEATFKKQRKIKECEDRRKKLKNILENIEETINSEKAKFNNLSQPQSFEEFILSKNILTKEQYDLIINKRYYTKDCENEEKVTENEDNKLLSQFKNEKKIKSNITNAVKLTKVERKAIEAAEAQEAEKQRKAAEAERQRKAAEEAERKIKEQKHNCTNKEQIDKDYTDYMRFRNNFIGVYENLKKAIEKIAFNDPKNTSKVKIIQNVFPNLNTKQDILGKISGDIANITLERGTSLETSKQSLDAAYKRFNNGSKTTQIINTINTNCHSLQEVLKDYKSKFDNDTYVKYVNLYEDIAGVVRIYARINKKLCELVKDKIITKETNEDNNRCPTAIIVQNKDNKNCSRYIQIPSLHKNYGPYFGVFSNATNSDLLNGFDTHNPKQSITDTTGCTMTFDSSRAIKPTIDQVIDGYNVNIFGYGYSGAGKTFTLYGAGKDNKGIVQEIFNKTANNKFNNETIEITRIIELYGLGSVYSMPKFNKNRNFDTEDYVKELVKLEDNEYHKGLYASQHSINYFDLIKKSKKNKDLGITVSSDRITFDSKKDIGKAINHIIDVIEFYRKINGGIKATPNNPESSRGHLMITLSVQGKGNLTIGDFGGIESPFDILETFIPLNGIAMDKNKKKEYYKNLMKKISLTENNRSIKNSDKIIEKLDRTIRDSTNRLDISGSQDKKVNEVYKFLKYKSNEELNELNKLIKDKKYKKAFIQIAKFNYRSLFTETETGNKDNKLNISNVSDISEIYGIKSDIIINLINIYNNLSDKRKKEISFENKKIDFVKILMEGFYINETLNNMKSYFLAKADNYNFKNVENSLYFYHVQETIEFKNIQKIRYPTNQNEFKYIYLNELMNIYYLQNDGVEYYYDKLKSFSLPIFDNDNKIIELMQEKKDNTILLGLYPNEALRNSDSYKKLSENYVQKSDFIKNYSNKNIIVDKDKKIYGEDGVFEKKKYIDYLSKDTFQYAIFNSHTITNIHTDKVGMFSLLELLNENTNQTKPSKFVMLALINPRNVPRFIEGAKATLEYADKIASTGTKPTVPAPPGGAGQLVKT